MTHETKEISGLMYSHDETLHQIFSRYSSILYQRSIKHTVRGRYNITVYYGPLEIAVWTKNNDTRDT